VELPNFVVLQATYWPALQSKKATLVSGGGKPATLSTGLNISVPYHIKQGDTLKIDTPKRRVRRKNQITVIVAVFRFFFATLLQHVAH
jgi:hypothetical protein